ncbi:hypothetical protein HC031_18100 [Planosporangium thailandense]|uniref:DUF1453 domain-containing protein n=1 Tax=Planosporangium thailandense TaxID=765197 RepID=A0ABX0Y0C8_9ACTN|nr:hypothetical protein [Planosporangium thailandense]NJC71617.1 hypothetical protein [Planosporangium thailandense]
MTAARIVPIALIAGLVILRMYRRARPQPVRPRAIGIRTAIIGFLLLLAIVGSAPILVSSPLGLIVAPVALAAGCGIGWLLVRTVKFYTDPNTGELWMRGDAVFMAIILATFVLRIAVQFAAGPSQYGPNGTVAMTHPTPLRVISTDLIFLSAGMWVTRGILLLARHRRHRVETAPQGAATATLTD